MNFIIILNYIKDTRAKPHGCLKLLNKCAIISISRLHLSKSQVLFALKFLRVQPCWSIFCQWRAGQKVLTHVLPVKVRKSWHTFASEGKKVPKHLILLPHILAVLTLILMPLSLILVAALPFDHIHVFTTIKPQCLTKRMRNRVGLLTTAFVPQVGWNDRSEN